MVEVLSSSFRVFTAKPLVVQILRVFYCSMYRKTPKISDIRKLSCNTPKIQIKGPNLRVFLQRDANGIANSEDPDQTAPLGAV